MPNPVEPIAYTLRTAAEASGRSETLLHRAVKSGDLRAKRTSQAPDGEVPKVEVRHRVLFDIVELDDYIEQLKRLR